MLECSNNCRKPSPSVLKPNTAMKKAIAGGTTTNGFVRKYRKPSASIAPHSGTSAREYNLITHDIDFNRDSRAPAYIHPYKAQFAEEHHHCTHLEERDHDQLRDEIGGGRGGQRFLSRSTQLNTLLQ